MNELNQYKKTLGVTWIRAESGRTYLCSVDALNRLQARTDADLARVCVDESENPQND